MWALKIIKRIRLGTTLSLFLIGSVAACSPAKRYLDTNTDTDTIARDVASCQSKASDLMARELILDKTYDRSGGHSLEMSFSRFDAHKQRSHVYHGESKRLVLVAQRYSMSPLAESAHHTERVVEAPDAPMR